MGRGWECSRVLRKVVRRGGVKQGDGKDEQGVREWVQQSGGLTVGYRKMGRK